MSETTNAAPSDDDGVFSIAKLKAAMRKLDALISDDVIAVTMLCPPDKSYNFADEKGSVTVVSFATLHRLKKAIPPPSGNPLLGGVLRSPFGIPVIYADEEDVAALEVRRRVVRSLDAAAEVQAWWDSWK